MARPEEQVGEWVQPRIWTARFAAGVVLLIGLVLAIAAIDRGAPYSWLEGRGGLWFAGVVVVAIVVSVARLAVERRRRVKLVQPGGPAWGLTWALVLFQLATIPGVLALGLADTVLLVAGATLSGPVTRALFLLLIGGVGLTIAGRLIRDLLVLSHLRRK